MGNIIKVIKDLPDVLTGNGVDESSIFEAEKNLSIEFSEEYKTYLKNFGIAACDGHELTGISKSKRTNVTDVTINNRKRSPHDMSDYYVIEESGIDDIVVWQKTNGIIYTTSYDSDVKELYKSLEEYLRNC